MKINKIKSKLNEELDSVTADEKLLEKTNQAPVSRRIKTPNLYGLTAALVVFAIMAGGYFGYKALNSGVTEIPITTVDGTPEPSSPATVYGTPESSSPATPDLPPDCPDTDDRYMTINELRAIVEKAERGEELSLDDFQYPHTSWGSGIERWVFNMWGGMGQLTVTPAFGFSGMKFIKPYAEHGITLPDDGLEAFDAYMALPPVTDYTTVEHPQIGDIVGIPLDAKHSPARPEYAAFIWIAPNNRSEYGYDSSFWSVIIAEAGTGRISNLYCFWGELTEFTGFLWANNSEHLVVSFSNRNYGTNFVVLGAEEGYNILGYGWQATYHDYETFKEQGVVFDFELELNNADERKLFPLTWGVSFVEGRNVWDTLICYYEWTDTTGKIQYGSYEYNIFNDTFSNLQQNVKMEEVVPTRGNPPFEQVAD